MDLWGGGPSGYRTPLIEYVSYHLATNVIISGAYESRVNQLRQANPSCGFGQYNPGLESMLLSILPFNGYLFMRSLIHLINCGNVRHQHIGFTRITQQLIPGAVGIEQHNVSVRYIKKSVVIAAFP